ncbi:MAG: 3-isopropylmalate dehydratase large subunit [Kiritimatiellae bacterium]|nr:3-isopropylmalate dehydratase large subunit [Kiritimatiellia bacterium]
MSMTMTQKIIAAHVSGSAGCPHPAAVRAGELVMAKLDLVLGNDITAPVAIREFPKFGRAEVFDREKVALVPDHFTPNKDIKAAQQCAAMRAFAQAQGIVNYFEVGHDCGIEHALLPEKGLVTAGDLVIGADSHTCTYGALGAFSTGVGSTDMAAGMSCGETWLRVPAAIKVELRGKPRKWVGGKDVILHLIGLIGVDGARYMSLEFTGDGVANLSMDDRFTIANMAIEAGAKNGIFPVDEKTLAYFKAHSSRPPKIFTADPDAEYERTVVIDLAALEPVVAFPHLPSNVRPVREAGEIKVDQVVIGSCTNGRISDMRVAAEVMRGRQVADGVRCIVIPATQRIYLQAMEEGLLKTFVEAGCVVSPPTCGPCLGGHMGILAKGERCVATTNRNFVGRMGHVESEIYLASPAVAAASALAGRITEPDNVER